MNNIGLQKQKKKKKYYLVFYKRACKQIVLLSFQVKGDENTNFVAQKQEIFMDKFRRVYQKMFARSYPQEVCLNLQLFIKMYWS